MSELEHAVVNAACDVRIQVGKTRMVDVAISLSVELSETYGIDVVLIEDMIWDKV